MSIINRVSGVLIFVFVVQFLCANNYNQSISQPDSIIKTVELDTLKNQQIIDSLKLKLAPTDEMEIKELVHKLHKSWQKFAINTEEEEILQYFTPMFVVSQVAVYTEDKGKIMAYTNKEFRKFLKSFKKAEKISIEFSDIDFLDIEVKNHKYFNTVYKCILSQKDHNGELHTSSAIITITGRRISDEWKIGNYSWVNFEYH
ncbi:hypothetical protein [Carboxylicivirga marina]|uniref:hypothetical protein n=1 Tax=Carboxylicivirga marina TaxID=2800988 RepID=UPI002597F5DE|nr:hypothetical protein [uncultured Carboxylicivirga sp.]